MKNGSTIVSMAGSIVDSTACWRVQSSSRSKIDLTVCTRAATKAENTAGFDFCDEGWFDSRDNDGVKGRRSSFTRLTRLAPDQSMNIIQDFYQWLGLRELRFVSRIPALNFLAKLSVPCPIRPLTSNAAILLVPTTTAQEYLFHSHYLVTVIAHTVPS